MSRDHSSLPVKSNPFSMPVPVMTQTALPSVTGDGDDIFCLRILTSPPPSGRFQRTSPFVRSRHHRKRFPLSAMLRKIRLPQMIGVEPLHAGIATFQTTFSSVVHFTG